jgi:hypothetical protein
MAGTATITGVVGPASTVTAQVFTNITSFTFDMVNNVVQFTQSDPNRTQQIAISAATTVTITKSGSTYVVTIS